GGQHKLAGIHVAYKIDPSRPFGRGLDGEALITVAKDRPGFVRPACGDGRTVGRMKVRSDGAYLGITIEPLTGRGPFRPTEVMERISQLLERADAVGGLTRNRIEAEVR